jgi:hypothetical protein
LMYFVQFECLLGSSPTNDKKVVGVPLRFSCARFNTGDRLRIIYSILMDWVQPPSPPFPALVTGYTSSLCSLAAARFVSSGLNQSAMESHRQDLFHAEQAGFPSSFPKPASSE